MNSKQWLFKLFDSTDIDKTNLQEEQEGECCLEVWDQLPYSPPGSRIYGISAVPRQTCLPTQSPQVSKETVLRSSGVGGGVRRRSAVREGESQGSKLLLDVIQVLRDCYQDIFWFGWRDEIKELT